ncbi:hypothetical protein FQN54_007805 [Arachnomyces sp. PD_36]|nr:hypothetical protein FQN54_007805 [Arachnomyces sp. PD_36]
MTATSGDINLDQLFESHWTDAKKESSIHGAYHDARPSAGAGKDQAKFVLQNGGRWIHDNATLPGTLQIRAPEVGDPCFGLSPNQTLFLDDWTYTYFEATRRKSLLRVDVA